MSQKEEVGIGEKLTMSQWENLSTEKSQNHLKTVKLFHQQEALTT